MTGHELKRQRQILRLTQEQMAQAIDVTHSTIARWEQMKERHIPGSRLLELAIISLKTEKKKAKAA